MEYNIEVKIEGKYALINRKGEIENFSKYKDIGPFYEFDGRWCARAVTNSGKYCLIRRDGSKAINDVYDWMRDLDSPHKYQSYCLLEVAKDGKYGCIELNSWSLYEKIPCEYESLELHEWIIIAEKNNLYGLLDYINNTKVPFKYKYIFSKYYGFRAVTTDGDDRYFDHYGHKLSRDDIE